MVTEEASVPKRADVEKVRLWRVRSPLGWECLLLECWGSKAKHILFLWPQGKRGVFSPFKGST